MINNIPKKIAIEILFLLLLFSCFTFVSAQSGTDQGLCFLKLQIKETLKNYALVIKDPNIKMNVALSLVGQENYYGKEYPLKEYNPDNFFGNYILNTYDAENDIIKKYSVPTSLIVSNFSGPGEILKDGVINAAIPYDANIRKITINNNGVETDLKINSSLIKCERTCKIENEKGDYGKNECCSGFIPATQEDGSFVCVKCGDNICSQNENKYSCPEDCLPKNSVTPQNTDQPNKKWDAKNIIAISGAVILALIIIIGVVIFIVIKKRNRIQTPQ